MESCDTDQDAKFKQEARIAGLLKMERRDIENDG
jgi:hypothetical protein